MNAYGLREIAEVFPVGAVRVYVLQLGKRLKVEIGDLWHVDNKSLERRRKERYPQSRVVVEMKCVDSCYFSEAIHILQLVVVEMKLVNSCDTFEPVNILQFIFAEIKSLESYDTSEAVHIQQLVAAKIQDVDSCDTSEVVDMFQSFRTEINVFCFSGDNFLSQPFDLLYEFGLLWLLIKFC